jgi:hypothetical protein
MGLGEAIGSGLGSGLGGAGGASTGALSASQLGGALAGGAAGATGSSEALSGSAAGGASAVAGPGAGGLTSILSNPAVLGMGAGALLGGLGSSQGTQAGTVEVEEGLPDWLMPYVKPTLDQYSTQVQNHQVDPYGIMPAAMKEFQNTVSGMYLDPSTNKYLEDYYRLGAERVKGSLSPSFGHMQAFGAHSGYNEALSRGLSDMATNLYGGAYETERNRQNQMIAAAPSFLGQSSTAAFSPFQQYLSSVGSLGKKKEEPFFTNPWSGAMGGALVGSQFGNIFK